MGNFYIYAFATFGHPSDFQQDCILPIKNKLPHKIKLFELTHAIKVFPKSNLYSIRFEKINGEIYISYSIYSYTKELLSDRDGTFIGSSILFSNKLPDVSLLIENLKQFHNVLISKNVKDGRLLINHLKDLTLTNSISEDFNKIVFNEEELDPKIKLINSNSSLVVWAKDDNLGINYKKSIQLFEKYDTIYFTESKEIAEFTKSRGIYKTIDEKSFDSEINNLIEERKRKKERSISEFELEVQIILEDKKRINQEYKTQLEQFRYIHQTNSKKISEVEGDISKINKNYEQFISKTNKLIENLKYNNAKLEEVKNIHNDYKRSFYSKLPNLKSTNYITTIEKPKPKGNLDIEEQWQNNEFRSGNRRREENEDIEEKSYKIDIFKAATIVLSFLLIVTWGYFLFYKSNTENESEVFQNQEQVNTDPQEELDETKEIEDLNPKSNSKLNENDYRIVAKSLNPNMKSDEVVKVIFNKNPTEIGSIYIGQEAIYSKKLIELNKQCFEEKEGVYFFKNDTIKQIPSYKKNNE
jgi:hypothetical protein